MYKPQHNQNKNIWTFFELVNLNTTHGIPTQGFLRPHPKLPGRQLRNIAPLLPIHQITNKPYWGLYVLATHTPLLKFKYTVCFNGTYSLE